MRTVVLLYVLTTVLLLGALIYSFISDQIYDYRIRPLGYRHRLNQNWVHLSLILLFFVWGTYCLFWLLAEFLV